MFVNARSLLTDFKVDELIAYADEKELDVIGIAETRLNGNILDREIILDGFTLYRKDRCKVREGRGGGVLLYVKNSLVSVDCPELNNSDNESVWCKILDSNKKSTIVGVVYKSTSAQLDEIDGMLSMLKSLSKEQVLVMGDFNYPNINWSSYECDTVGGRFLEVILDNFWTQHVHLPTREGNILDLVISSEEGMVENLTVDEHLANSDHNMVNFCLVLVTQINNSSKKRLDFNKGDYVRLREHLNETNWEHELIGKDVDTMWCSFRDILTESITMYIPLAKSCRRKYPRWMTREARIARKCKYKMWKRFQLSQSYNDKVEYKRALNAATNACKDAKRSFEKKLSDEIKVNPKSFYSYVRSKSKTKDQVCPLKTENGNMVVKDEDVCEVLNDYFSSVFTREDINCSVTDFPILRDFFPGDQDDVLHDISIDEELVLSKLRKLKLNKAPGIDGIVPLLLVKTADIVCKPLSIIFSSSLTTGTVPVDWRRANVTAIFKQGVRNNPGNYRPVSLTCQVCKILESIIKDKVQEHLDKFDLIKASQHGFRKHRSCLTNLLEFLQFTRNSVDCGEPVDVIYLDFQKAFDKIPHKRLIMKVEAYGVKGNISRWISNWLQNREQRVVLNQACSQFRTVLSGVPQGSVLGPLLFVMFINDIDSCVVNKLSKFADDTKVFSIVSDQVKIDKLRCDLLNLFKWSQDWQMLFNINKCKVMHFGRSNARAVYFIGGQQLEEVDNEKDLGIIVQKDLKVSEQCVKAVKTANRVLGMINRAFTYKTREIVLQLYRSLVRPHLEYCVQAWRPHLKKDIILLEGVQKRVTKMMGTYNCTYEERAQELGITTLETRRLRGDLIEVFKIFKGLDCIDVHAFFTLSTGTSRGHSFKLFKSRFNTDVGKYSFGNRVINEWNLLTEDMLACDTLYQFKFKLDRHLKLCRGFL